MAFLQNGLLLVGAGSSQQQIIRGLVLLLAVGFDVYSKTQGRPSLTGRLLGGLRIPKEPKRGDLVREPQPASIEDQPKVTLP
jgi:putative multiple sugar transport system permease protein